MSNHEKKLEAVRSGVRAISVSGKIEVISDMLSVAFGGCNLPWFPLLSLFLSSHLFTYLCTASHSSLSIRTVSPSLSNSSCCLSPSASLASPSSAQIDSDCFFSHFKLGNFSVPPKSTRAQRFLLPFVFCSDSPPNGISTLNELLVEERIHHITMICLHCSLKPVAEIWNTYIAQ